MKILMISSEGWPLARPGALADVLTALPRELKERGHELALTMPYYREVRENPTLQPESLHVAIKISVGEKIYEADILEARTPDEIQIFFIRCDEFYDRSRLYREEDEPFTDNAARFIFFAKAVIELARRMTPTPDVLHAHDWSTALVPVFVRTEGLPFATVLSIHHLAEQGDFPAEDFALTNLSENYFDLHGLEFFGRMNFLKAGILFADRVVVSSEAYAHAIQTQSLGEGLDGVLREHAHKLNGIPGGADYQRWNPQTDKFLPTRYGPKSLDRKTASQAALLDQLGLAPTPRGPVCGMVTRLVGEKGFDILLPVLDRLLSDDVRLVILGKGDPAYETSLGIAARRYPQRLAYRHDYDEALAHLIEAGSDLALIPSRTDPGGVTAMHSLKYGVLPVARATRGIEQIITDYDPSLDTGYGFLFYRYDAEALWDSIKRAKEVFANWKEWERLRQRAVALDFSWELAAERYEALYQGIVENRKAA